MEMILVEVFTALIIGFSLFTAAILLVAYLFFLPNMQKSIAGKIACTVLLVSLSGLQLHHLGYLLVPGPDLFSQPRYVVLLLITPPAFFFFSRELLLPEPQWSLWQLLHLVPVVAAFLLPADVVTPVAFTIGAGYSIWFARVVYGMRRQVSRFRFEMFFFAFFAVLAVLVLALFLLLPFIDDSVFFFAYANFTGLALLLIVAALIIFPELLEDITDAARAAYAQSTLGAIDVPAKLAALERLMQEDKIFQNENLNLSVLAKVLELKGHQLSELINSHFGVGFSRYVREQRIAEAQRLLREDRDASILSISLTTGFKSQSNFYAAFSEIVGMSPGAWRKPPE